LQQVPNSCCSRLLYPLLAVMHSNFQSFPAPLLHPYIPVLGRNIWKPSCHNLLTYSHFK
jgi:hypothetical protein